MPASLPTGLPTPAETVPLPVEAVQKAAPSVAIRTAARNGTSLPAGTTLVRIGRPDKA